MNTQDLAKRMYTLWASQMDMIEPLEYGEGRLSNRAVPRLKWDSLDSINQDIWLSLASDIVTVLEPKPVLSLAYDDR